MLNLRETKFTMIMESEGEKPVIKELQGIELLGRNESNATPLLAYITSRRGITTTVCWEPKEKATIAEAKIVEGEGELPLNLNGREFPRKTTLLVGQELQIRTGSGVRVTLRPQ